MPVTTADDAAADRADTSLLGRVVAWHARLRARRVLGVRFSAIVEVLVMIAFVLVLDAWRGEGNRFIQVTPHPFWIPVLLAAVYYGTREGLFAALVASVALFYDNFPEPPNNDGGYGWLLRATLEPLLWLITAVVLGEIRDAQRRRMGALRGRVEWAEEQADALNRACEQLTRQKTVLESRIADQTVTVHAMYKASRAIERDGVGDVLLGVAQLVRTALNPQKFSMYLTHAGRLEAAISDGWTHGDRYTRVFDSSSPLHRAIVQQRRSVNVVNPIDEPLLREEGLLAAPIVNQDRGDVIGMLKVEAMEFLDLNAGTVQNFQVLCDWIGAAITHAQRMERMQQVGADAPASRIAPLSLFDTLVASTRQLTDQARMPASVLWMELTFEQATAHAMQVAARAIERATPPPHIACATSPRGGYAVLMPGLALDGARPHADRVVQSLRAAIEQAGLHAMVRHRLMPLGASQAT